MYTTEYHSDLASAGFLRFRGSPTSQQVTEQLIFRPASELPTADLDGRDVLVLNPCDGWHEGEIHAWEEDGEVYHVGIYTFMMDEMTPHDFYVAWALLPNSLELSEKFKDQKRKW